MREAQSDGDQVVLPGPEGRDHREVTIAIKGWVDVCVIPTPAVSLPDVGVAIDNERLHVEDHLPAGTADGRDSLFEVGHAAHVGPGM